MCATFAHLNFNFSLAFLCIFSFTHCLINYTFYSRKNASPFHARFHHYPVLNVSSLLSYYSGRKVTLLTIIRDSNIIIIAEVQVLSQVKKVIILTEIAFHNLIFLNWMNYLLQFWKNQNVDSPNLYIFNILCNSWNFK